RSAHDCSEGGLAVALAEMAFAGGFGATLRLDNVPYKGSLTRDDVILFSESNTRFVVEVPAKHKNKFEKIFKGIPAGLIGQVEKSPEFVVYGRNRNVCINAYIQELKTVWQRPLKNQL
ncbi:MAG: phosphoribosylformylglycinamidine synthase, partial [Candidatus Omnitrophica bacterium CG12_big_fil_rev_8_21_14_0_65_50_5]